MKLAIMQPYLFPYIGYFQLINAVDKFVIYDDVNFIKRGWINRNRILVNGIPTLFTIPLCKASQNKLICDIKLADTCNRWKEKFLRTLNACYRKAPNFAEAYLILNEIIRYDTYILSEYILNSVKKLCDYMEINTTIGDSSKIYNNEELKGQSKIVDICIKEGASNYINPKGGQELYDKSEFEKNGIKLNFIDSGSVSYNQFTIEFKPWLSIIDVLMFNDKISMTTLLASYSLI